MDNTGELVTRAAATVDRESEKQLIGLARAGDRCAMRELVVLHKDRLFAFIWRMVRHHHDAEEICQDAFLKAFASLDTFCVDYRFSTWLFTIGYRVCLNRMRRKDASTGQLDLSATPLAADDTATASLESEDAVKLKNMVWGAVDRLSTQQRATILLFYRHELSCQEIARALELPVATVKSHLHRARNRLRDMLEPLDNKDLDQFRNLSGLAG